MPEAVQQSRRDPERRSIGSVRNPAAHQAIIKAAGEVLDEAGYPGFTFEAVARRAGSSKPTLYRWWPNKAALIIEVYERGGEEPLKLVDTGDVEADVASLYRRLWIWWRDTRAGEVLRAVVAEAQLSAESAAALREGFVPRRKEALTTLLKLGRERGQIAHDADVEAAVSLLMGVGWLHLLTADLDDSDGIEPYVALLFAGLRR